MNRNARRQIVERDTLPTPVREAVMKAKGKPVRVVVPKLNPLLDVPVPKGVRLQ